MPGKLKLLLNIAKVLFAADEIEQVALAIVPLKQTVGLTSVALRQRIEAALGRGIAHDAGNLMRLEALGGEELPDLRLHIGAPAQRTHPDRHVRFRGAEAKAGKS